MVKEACLITLILLLATHGWAQQRDNTRSEIQEDLERAMEGFDPSDPEFGNEQLIQYIQNLATNPVNINVADVDALLRVPAINLKIARAIITYREEVKPFEKVDELTRVNGLGSVTLEKIRPYITIGSGLAVSKALYTDYRYWMAGGNFEMFSRYQQTLQQQEGYRRSSAEGGYMGSPVKYYQRMRYRSNHLSANITQEKDPGEPFGGITGFDYFSWHIALQDNGKLQDLVFGDYGLSFGQGLVLWDGGAFGKGREVIGTVNRNERGVSPYASAQETGFYRGAAATYGGLLQLTGFYSFRKRSASVIAGDTIRFPQSDGFHRTQNEREQLNNTRQELYGGHLRLELPFGFIGATGYKTVFNKFIDGGNAVYDRFNFSGMSTSAFGVDYKFLLGPSLVFGEVGRSKNGGYGVITGVESPIGDDTELTLAYRKYEKDFQSILGDGFGESSGEPQNEEGIYLGLRHALNKTVTLSGYFDQYRFPAPRFGTYQPTGGYDWLGLIEIECNSNLYVYVQARNEIKDDEFEATDVFGRIRRKLGQAQRGTVRTQLEYQINPKVRIRTRGEIVQSRQAGEDKEYGYLLYQDLRLIPDSRWKIDARITVFNTGDFDTRVYQFENDLLYVLSNEMLYGEGQRFYVLMNYEPFEFMEIWTKLGVTIFEDQLTVGSGLNKIRGRSRSDIGVQMRIKF